MVIWGGQIEKLELLIQEKENEELVADAMCWRPNATRTLSHSEWRSFLFELRVAKVKCGCYVGCISSRAEFLQLIAIAAAALESVAYKTAHCAVRASSCSSISIRSSISNRIL